MSLLFRSLTGYPTTLLSTQRYVFSQRGNATNEFGLFFGFFREERGIFHGASWRPPGEGLVWAA